VILVTLRADLETLMQVAAAQLPDDQDISARLTALDIKLQGLEVTQQRQLVDPNLALILVIQQQRMRSELQRLAFDVLGYQALIQVAVGDNEPLPKMLSGVPPQMIKLARAYLSNSSVDSTLLPNETDESIYAQLAALLIEGTTSADDANQDIV
jgi:hypothetical protein